MYRNSSSFYYGKAKVKRCMKIELRELQCDVFSKRRVRAPSCIKQNIQFGNKVTINRGGCLCRELLTVTASHIVLLRRSQHCTIFPSYTPYYNKKLQAVYITCPFKECHPQFWLSKTRINVINKNNSNLQELRFQLRGLHMLNAAVSLIFFFLQHTFL